MDPVNLLDIRLSKVVKLGGDYSLELMVDVYNTLNTNVATRVVETLGTKFEYPIMIMTPRTVRVGARFNF